jgi:hypothetical protein
MLRCGGRCREEEAARQYRERPPEARRETPIGQAEGSLRDAPRQSTDGGGTGKRHTWSSVRKGAIGPVVSGNPTSSPLTAGPQRRPARLTAPISTGVRMSFNVRLSIARTGKDCGIAPWTRVGARPKTHAGGEPKSH